MDCRTGGKPFLGRQDTGHLPVCCTIQNKAQDLKAVEETVEGLQRVKDSRRHGRWAKFGENCGEFWKRGVARSRQVCIYWLWKHCLLLSILPEGQTNTYRHRKTPSDENLSRDSWSLSSSAFPAGSCPAEVYECTNVRTCE